MFKLTIEDDEGKTTVVPLARDEMTIGRNEGNTIRLTERNVSRRHARLVRQNGAIFIEDLSSFTGVRVNGAKIASPTALREGDEIQIGDYRIALRGDRPGPSPADRPTMPSLPAVMGPMATVGGSVAIPTRASVAAMAAQPMPSAAATPSPAPQPLASAATSARKSGGGPAVVLAPADLAPVSPFPAALTPAPVPIRDGTPKPVAVPSAAPDVSEAQPTIPIRTLGETAPAPGPAARLCALTTDLAGTLYPLDRASLVIGRTDENDVVIPHRSISRHHAKIVRDGDHYTIVDLQSANGVRVNGEDYERIELKSGDIIELGHVKLRFVAPHEDFAFDPRSVAARGGAPTKIVVLGVAGLAIVAGLVLALVHRGQHGASAGEAPPVPPVTVAAAPAVAPPPTAAPAEVPAPVPAGQEAPYPPVTPAVLLSDARAAAAAEDWEKARTTLDRLGPTIADPAIRRDVVGLRRRVDTERQAAVAFTQFDEAVGAKNFADAVGRYQEIPSDSIYKRRARPRYEEAKSAAVAEHLAAAERARGAGRCAEVRSEADEVLKLDPRNLLARDVVRLCRARAEATAPPVTTRLAVARPRASAAIAADTRSEAAPKRAEAPRPEPARAEAPAEADGPDPDALMKQAREAWMRQQCGAAIEFSRKALHAKPGMTDAYQIIAVCSCTLKDGEAAGRAYAKLDDKNRNLVRALCQRNGVAVGE